MSIVATLYKPLTLLDAVTVTGAGQAVAPSMPGKAFQAWLNNISGASVQVNIEASNDGVHWVVIHSLALSGAAATGAYSTGMPYAYWRGNVITISGASTAVTLVATESESVIESARSVHFSWGNLAMAASEAWYSDWLNLARYPGTTLLLVTKSGLPSAGEVLSIQGSYDGGVSVFNLHTAEGGMNSAYNSVSGTAMFAQGRPSAPLARVRFTNGSTAQTALKMGFCLLAGGM